MASNRKPAVYICANATELILTSGVKLMSSNAQKRVKGCGKTGQIFTLYHISIFDGTARPLAQGFKHLACGCCASTFQKMTYGIVLCLNCADHLGFPPLPVAKTESAKPSRP